MKILTKIVEEVTSTTEALRHVSILCPLLSLIPYHDEHIQLHNEPLLRYLLSHPIVGDRF